MSTSKFFFYLYSNLHTFRN